VALRTVRLRFLSGPDIVSCSGGELGAARNQVVLIAQGGTTLRVANHGTRGPCEDHMSCWCEASAMRANQLEERITSPIHTVQTSCGPVLHRRDFLDLWQQSFEINEEQPEQDGSKGNHDQAGKVMAKRMGRVS
jgi:hypothetical protein